MEGIKLKRNLIRGSIPTRNSFGKKGVA